MNDCEGLKLKTNTKSPRSHTITLSPSSCTGHQSLPSILLQNQPSKKKDHEPFSKTLQAVAVAPFRGLRGRSPVGRYTDVEMTQIQMPCPGGSWLCQKTANTRHMFSQCNCPLDHFQPRARTGEGGIVHTCMNLYLSWSASAKSHLLLHLSKLPPLPAVQNACQHTARRKPC